MLGRWFVLAVVGIGLAVIIHGHPSNASTGTVTFSCADAASDSSHALGVRAAVAWHTPSPPPGQIWFDVSVTRAFVDGTWTGHGPLPGNAGSFTTDALTPEVPYYYRVKAVVGGEWTVIASGSFIAACPDS